MSRYDYVGISIHANLYHSINSHIDEKICLSQYRSVTDFIENAIKEKLEKCNIPIINRIESLKGIEYKLKKIFGSIEKINKIGDKKVPEGYYSIDNGETLIIIKQILQEGRGDFRKSFLSASREYSKIIIISPSFNQKILYTLDELQTISKISIVYITFNDLNEIESKNQEKITFEKLTEMNLHHF